MDATSWWTVIATFLIGVAVTLALRALLGKALLAKFNADVRKLNAGDYSSLLKSYRDDAVLHFNDDEHRWAGDHRGKAAIERFLQDFVKAGINGNISEVFFAGPPWKLTLLARFDDHAEGPDGAQIYHNSTVLLIRTTWGKIYEQFDYYEDTSRIPTFDKRLTELGILPVR